MYNAVICAIIKDEIDLEEWAAYHIALGFEHIYIYDNVSAIPIKNRLQPLVDAKLVTVIPWTKTSTGAHKSFQFAAYNDYLLRFKNSARQRGNAQTSNSNALQWGGKWTAFIDGDEYIALKKEKTIGTFLSSFEAFDSIGLNWIMMGSSHLESTPHGKLVIEAYTLCEPDTNLHLKRIVKTAKTISYYAHHGTHIKGSLEVDSLKRTIDSGPFNKNVYCVDPSMPDIKNVADVACVYHYFARSRKHWAIRVERGDVQLVGKTKDELTRYNYSMEKFDDLSKTMNIKEDLFMLQSDMPERVRNVLLQFNIKLAGLEKGKEEKDKEKEKGKDNL